MKLYEQFFDREAAGRPYGSNQEAVEDMLALVDLYLNMVFYNRDIGGERLDMRGVVITPGEFKSALTDRILRVRNMEDGQTRLYSEAIAAEARAAAEHMRRRAGASRIGGGPRDGGEPLPGGGWLPGSSAGPQPGSGAGPQPRGGAGPLPGDSAGPQPGSGAGSQPRVVAGLQPSGGAGPQPGGGAGPQPGSAPPPTLPPTLRLLRLMECLPLSPLEYFCLCLALAGEYDRKYERIFGYAQDNVGARQATLGLGISLYRMGLGPQGRQRDLWIAEDSLLWRCLLKDTAPPHDESGLSRPMVPRSQVMRFLREGRLIPENWKEFARQPHGEPEGSRLHISLPGLLEFCRSRPPASLTPGGGIGEQPPGSDLPCEILSWLYLAGRYQNRPLSFDCAPDTINSTPITSPDLSVDLRRLTVCAAGLGLGPLPINRLGACATPVNAACRFEDLILEESQKRLLLQMCSQVKYREQVMEQWGFRRKAPYGNGISAIFYGPPGTGKTMAAQIIGNELGMDTYKIDLSRMMSKYIGETEKNLEEMFRRAGEQQVILFFDEADGLFAKRTAVDSSNDRYANTETGYLLQRLEEYDGIVILATNFINNIDEAFKRRIKFFVKFTFPDRSMRLQLWNSMLPEMAPVEEELNFPAFAARFELTGSDIRSVMTAGAYLAAAAGRGIRNEDIQESLRIHYRKMGKKLGEAELRL